jgi:hypothetical protein
MALNRDKVGTSYPSYTYEVSREKIREYASALGESDPRYFSDGDDCVAPPTFAACFTVIKGGPPRSVTPTSASTRRWSTARSPTRSATGTCVPGTCSPARPASPTSASAAATS